MEQETSKKGNKLSRGIRGLIFGITALLIAAVLYVGAVLLESPEARQDDSWAVVDDEEIVSPLQAASMNDVSALARHFGAPLPAFPGVIPQGEARNVIHDGKTVRKVTLKYNGVEITALRPASAAPLLLQSDLSISLRSNITAVNLPAVLAEGKGRYCLYFSSNQAAYSLSAPAESTEAFLQLAQQLRIIQ